MSNLVSVHFEIVLVSVQDRCTVYAHHTIVSGIVLDAPDGTAGDQAQLKDHFGPFGDSGNIYARWVHGLRRTYHSLANRFGRTRWNS